MNLKKLDTIKTPENWKRELLEQQKITKESSNTDFMKIKRMKWAMASLVLIVVCTMGITVGADTSNPFGEFLQSVFGTKKVQEVHLETTSNIGETNAYKEYEEPGAEIQLSNNMEIVGRNETFILEYNKEDSEKVKSVYCIKNSQLTSEQVNRFQGKYDGKDFSFDYVIKNNEICGFNYNGAVSEVFPVMEERTVYVALYQTKEDTVIKETIAKINLDTNEIIKLSNDKMICNFVLSPNGKTLLCNFRTKGYWSVFDLKNKTEKKTGVQELANWANDQSTWQEPPISIEPTQSYVSLTDGKQGIAVIPQGVREYEVLDDHMIRLTLFRTYGFMGKENLIYRPGRASGERIIETPAAQLLKEMDFAFGFTTYASDINEANVDTLAKTYNTNIEVYTYAEFLNGRLIFSQREIEGTKESRYSLFETENKLVVSAIKKAEDNDGYIIRLFNGKNHENISDTIKFNFDVKEAYYTNLREEKTEAIKVENNTISVKELSHCKFVTIWVK